MTHARDALVEEVARQIGVGVELNRPPTDIARRILATVASHMSNPEAGSAYLTALHKFWRGEESLQGVIAASVLGPGEGK